MKYEPPGRTTRLFHAVQHSSAIVAVAAIALPVIFVLALVIAAVANAEAPSIRRFALVIGTNNGGGKRVKLRYANTDALRIADVLKTFGGVNRRDMMTVQEATPNHIRAAFERLNARITNARSRHRRVELIVYYSGHSDETGLLPSGGHISWAELRAELRDTPADVRIAILDSCASGSLIRGKGGIRRAPFLMDQSSQVKGHAFLTSSSANEVAQESDRIGASYFTHHLVVGLRGAADVNSDRRVTLSEAYQYAFHRTLARTEKTRKGPQHPNYDFELHGSGDVVITALGAMASTMLFEKHMGGHYFVRDGRGRLVAELDKIPGRRVELGLEPGRYKVNLHRADKVLTTDVTLVRGKRMQVKAGHFRDTGPRERTRSRGNGAEESVRASNGSFPSRRINVQLVPGLSFVGAKMGTHVTRLSLNAIGGMNRSVTGVEVGGVFNMESHSVTGGQYAGAFNMVGGDFDGVQGAGSFNSVLGRFSGIQVTTIANIAAGGLRGIQVAAAVNIAGDVAAGGQIAGAVNVASGGLHGAQIAAVNVAAGKIEGVQIGGINIGDDVSGAQFGAVNITDDVLGMQLGVFNVADESSGLQLGLVNVAAKGDGRAIGLFNFIGDGYNRLEVWTSDTATFNAGLKFGSRWMYTILAYGTNGQDGSNSHQISLGWGSHVESGRWFWDFDVLAGVALEDRNRMDKRVDLLGKARVTLGRYIGRTLAIFGGAALNAATAFDGRTPRDLQLGTVGTLTYDSDARTSFGPGFFIGVSI